MRVPKLTFLVAFIMAGLASFLAWGWLEKLDRPAPVMSASVTFVTNARTPHVAANEQGLRGSLLEGAMEEPAKAAPVGFDQVRIQTRLQPSSPDAAPIIIVEFARGLRRSVYTVTREEW